MFACLCELSSQPNLFGFLGDRLEACPAGVDRLEACPTAKDGLEALAREFSPRVEVHRPNLVSLDIRGLGRLLGTPADIAEELQRAAEDRGLRLQVAVAPTRTAAMLLALASPNPPPAPRQARGRPEPGRRAGADPIVVGPGRERDAVACLPLGVLRQLPFDPSTLLRVVPSLSRGDSARAQSRASLRTSPSDSPGRLPAPGSRLPASSRTPSNVDEVVTLLRRWGLKTLGDLAGLPSRPLSERLGQHGVMWQRIARGEDVQPLIAREAEAPIEEVLDLEWPVEGLEPLSFVLARMCEPLAERLAARDLAAVALHLSFRLVSRETEARELQLPAPMRDPKVLRTLILLHLESHPLPGGVDRLALRVDAAPARITQFSLLARARPLPEQMATLLARLSALLGERRVGAAALVDTHRPGAFAMTRFSGGFDPSRAGVPPVSPAGTEAGATSRTGVPPVSPAGTEAGATSRTGVSPVNSDCPRVVLRRFRVPVPARVMLEDGRPTRVSMDRRGLEGGVVTAAAGPWRTSGDWWACDAERRAKKWSRDEWDVALSDGALYRVYRDRTADRWFVDGILD